MFIPSSYQLCIIVLVAYLSYLYTTRPLPMCRKYLPLVIMDTFPDFEELLSIPPVTTVGNYGTFSIASVCGYGDMGRGGFHQLKDLIISQFLILDTCTHS